jgi:asparagine synthase (glutamine-hydrolysing)
MRSALGTRHSRRELTAEDLMAALEDATVARDLPGMADVDFSLLSFCREIRKSVKVGLSGECADEIFGGYPWYRDPEVRMLEGFPWAQNTDYRASFLHPQYATAIDTTAFVMDRYRQTVKETDVLPGTSPQERKMKEMVNLNYRWFMQTLLDRKDRMSMYHGLEVRVPFCDYRIAEYLYGVPWEFKDYQGREKGLLRTAMEGVLPEAVLWRKKSPYPKTYDPRYLEMVSESLRRLLAQPNRPIFQIVHKEALEKLLTQEFIWPWYGQLMRLPQTIAYMLQLDFWMEEYKVSVI